MNAALDYLRSHPAEALAGTDVRIDIPLTRELINQVLAARPSGTPVRELAASPEAGNRLRIHLRAEAPVVGSVTRNITLVPGPAVEYPNQPWLHFDITSGLKFFDKPLINMLRGQIQARLPKGVEISSDYLRLHVPALLAAAGSRELIPLVKKIQLRSEPNRLLLHLHLSATS